MTDAKRRGLTGTVFRGTGLAGAGWAVGQVLNLGFYIALARLLTPEDFGQVAAGAIVVGVGELVANSGMVAALIQRRDRVEEAANTALIATLLGGLGLTLVALALAPLVGLFFDSGEITEIAAASSVWILLRCATNVPDAIMQRRFSFLRRVVVEPLGIVVFGTTAVVLAADGFGPWALVIAGTAQRVVMAVAAWLLARWRARPRLASFAMWKELIAFGRHVLAANLVGRASYEANTAVLGRFVGIDALGQFRYAARVAQKPRGLMVNAGSYVLFPAFSRISHDPERLERAYRRALRWIAAAAVPLGFVMLPLGEPLAVALFGEQWRDAGYAAMAMFAYVGARSIASVAGEAMKAAGEPRMLPRINLLSAVLSIAAIFALLPFGLVGVAAAVSVSSIGTVIYALRLAGGVTGLGLRRLRSELWPPLAASIVMAAVMLPVEHLLLDAAGRDTFAAVLMVGVELLLAAGIYLGVLAAIAPSSARAALELLRGALRRLRGRGGRRQAPVDEETEEELGVSTPAEEGG
jgi:PST family polysaccharide transporter